MFYLVNAFVFKFSEDGSVLKGKHLLSVVPNNLNMPNITKNGTLTYFKNMLKVLLKALLL